jgi:branched-chain amino acid transport system substrate-binding protein
MNRNEMRALALLCSLAAACDGPIEGDAVRVGVLLPYTGGSSSIGFNEERGALLVEQVLNDRAGGVADQRIELVFRDDASDPVRAAEATRALLDEGVVAIIGPGGDDAMPGVAEALAGTDVPLVSPLATIVPEIGAPPGGWFRLSPTAQVQGENLANLVAGEAIDRVVIIRESDPFHAEFASWFESRFVRRGGTIAANVEVSPGASLADATSAIQEGYAQGVSAVVLLLDALPAARVIGESAPLLAATPRWFLSSRAKSDIFLWNTQPEVVEGATGVAPDVFLANEEAYAEFDASFGRAWDGESPFEATCYVYDAAALALLALDRALRIEGGLSGGQLAASIRDVADFNGVSVGWNELPEAVEWNRMQTQLRYSGVTGPINFDEGDQRRSIPTRVWTIENNTIVTHYAE